MFRRLFMFASVVSLLLCVATCGMWVRSYRYHDSFDMSGSPTVYFVTNSLRGGFSLRLLTGQRHAVMPMSIESYSYAAQPTFHPTRVNWPRYGSQAGADFSSGRMVPNLSRILEVPFWLTTLGAAILPASWVMARQRRRAMERVGHCRRCGYDLRATPDRCPECGTVPKP